MKVIGNALHHNLKNFVVFCCFRGILYIFAEVYYYSLNSINTKQFKIIKIGVNIQMTHILKLRNIIIIYAVLIMIFIVSIFLSYSIPSSAIKVHVSDSISLFNKEGIHPLVNSGLKKTKLDNFTDMLMLNISISSTNGNHLKESLNNTLEQDASKNSATDADQFLSLKMP